jgi:hypothetical protein
MKKLRRLARALPYAVFVVLAAVSWNSWIEPYVDSGRELMVPWRVAQGERLYADVHFHHGPLGPWLGAASDSLFGRSLPARTGLAALLALVALVGLDRIARGLLGAGRAALATALAVAAAFFVRPGGWMFPFSVDCAIAVAALTWAVVLASGRGSRSWDGAAGFCLLAATFARVEMGIVGVAILAAHVLARREPLRLLRLAFFPLAAGAAAYATVSYGIPRERLVADGWLRVLDPPEAFRNVYRAYAGLDRPGLRMAELALAAVVLVLAAALVCLAAAAASRLGPKSAPVLEAAASAILLAAALVSLRPPAALAGTLALLPPLVRPVPPVIALAAAWRLALRVFRREPSGPLATCPDAVLWLGGFFATRILLTGGYGGPYGSFFLPLPLVLAVAGVFGLADRLGTPAAIGPRLPRLAFAALAIFLLARIAAISLLYRGPGWGTVATPAGSIRLPEPVAGATSQALADLASRVPGGGTLAGFPEAGFFAYALGLRGPFGTEQFFPGHLDAAGERRAIEVLEQRPPDVLLFANVLAVGEGARAFGTNYLRALDAAARADFPTAAIYGPGARPGARIGDPDFFVELRSRSRKP